MIRVLRMFSEALPAKIFFRDRISLHGTAQPLLPNDDLLVLTLVKVLPQRARFECCRQSDFLVHVRSARRPVTVG